MAPKSRKSLTKPSRKAIKMENPIKSPENPLKSNANPKNNRQKIAY